MSDAQFSGRLWFLVSILWIAGIILYSVLALYPVRFEFLNIVVIPPVTVDEVLHFLAFAWLAAAFPLIFRSRLMLFISPLMLILLGGVIEFWQIHIPGRRFSEADLIADTLGCITGALLGMGLRIWMRAWLYGGKKDAQE